MSIHSDAGPGFVRADFDPRRFNLPRLSNKQWLLGIIRTSDGVTRAELAGRTGISKSTVAQLVNELLSEYLVAESDQAVSGKPAAVGRKSGLLLPTLPDVNIVAVQFHHEYLHVVLAGVDGTVQGSETVPVVLNSPSEALLDKAAGMIERQLELSGVAKSAVAAVVMALPAPIDHLSGTVRTPSVLPTWSGTNPAERLAGRIGMNVHVANDADLGALGEHTMGAGRGHTNMMYLEVSEGIGAGLIINGLVYEGSGGIAGEIGHTQVDPAAKLCRCGQNGCLEVVASSIPVMARLRLVHDEVDATRDVESYDDDISARVLRESGHVLGKVLAEACNVLNPDAVVVGGELGYAHAAYLEGMREAIRRYAQPVVAQDLTIIPGELRNHAVINGALARAVHMVFGQEGALETTGHGFPRRPGTALVRRGRPDEIERYL